MPATSERQRRYMGMMLAEQRKTGHNETGMSEAQLRDFVKKRKRSRTAMTGRKRG